jgi:DNA-binding GntR family transcriptional regulator
VAIEMGDVEEVNRAIRSHLEQAKKDTLRYALEKGGGEKGQLVANSKG